MNAQEQATNIILKVSSIEDLFIKMENSLSDCVAFRTLLSMYKIERIFPDLSHFRLGPNMFENIPLQVIVIVNNNSSNSSELIAHGIMTDIFWNQSYSGLPDGWQGAVRKSYENTIQKSNKNTLVGLFVRVEKKFQQHGWAEKIICIMKELVRKDGYKSLIIPLRLPKRYELPYAKMPYAKFIALKRKDGQYLDYWLRLHTRLGGDVIGVSPNSHQHAMNLTDFKMQFNTKKIIFNGYYLSERQGLWYMVYVDKKRNLALINQECAWIRHI